MVIEIPEAFLRKREMEEQLRAAIGPGWRLMVHPAFSQVTAMCSVRGGTFWVSGDPETQTWSSGLSKSTGGDLEQEIEHPNVVAAIARAADFV